MRSPSATSRHHPSLQTKVSVNSGPSHPHDDPGTQTTSHPRKYKRQQQGDPATEELQ
jgi:hypothetical protein